MVKLSEEIASLRADERYEMMRILQELSERVRPHAAEIAMMPGLLDIWT